MSPHLKVTCSDCGHVRVPAAEVRLVLTAAPYYLFTCPQCGERVRRPARGPVVDLLRDAGVPTLG